MFLQRKNLAAPSRTEWPLERDKDTLQQRMLCLAIVLEENGHKIYIKMKQNERILSCLYDPAIPMVQCVNVLAFGRLDNIHIYLRHVSQYTER